MIKKVTLLALCLLAGATVRSYAQNSASATQTIHLQINPIIVIGNGGIKIKTNGGNNGNGNGGNGTNNGNGNGNNGNGNGNNGNGNGNGNSKIAGNNNNKDYAVNSAFVVSSNKEFIVSIKAEGDDNVYLALAENGTSGSASSKFSADYAPLATTSQDLLTNCSRGTDQRFSVNYKAKKPAKKTQVITKSDIIYTATLP